MPKSKRVIKKVTIWLGPAWTDPITEITVEAFAPHGGGWRLHSYTVGPESKNKQRRLDMVWEKML